MGERKMTTSGRGDLANYIVCPLCPNCRKFEQDTVGSPDYPYICVAHTSATAFREAFHADHPSNMAGRACPTRDNCKSFEAKAGGSGGGSSGSNSGSSGGGLGASAGENIIAGLGQTFRASDLNDAAGGVGKVGLGLAKLAIGGIKGAADKEKARQEEIERQKQEKREALQPFADGKYQEVNSVSIGGDETALLGGIGDLFGIMTGIKTMCEEKDDDSEAALSYSDKWDLFKSAHQAALSKFDEAVEKLQGQSSTGKIIGEFVDSLIISKRPEEFQKEAGEKLMEKQKANGLRSIDAIQIHGDTAACAESVIKLFDVIDIYKKHITAESVVDKKDRNLILGPVRTAAIAKIDSVLEKLHGLGAEGNAIATLFEEFLAVEKNLKFSDTTGKFHDKDNMPLLASVGDTLSKLNPFAKKDKPSSDSGTGDTSNAPSEDNPVESIKNKMGGLFGFGKKK